jgi:hypothetical protein
MKTALIIMTPRILKLNIEYYQKLENVDKYFFQAFTEKQLKIVLNNFIKDTDYDYYIISADDLFVYQRHLDTILENLNNEYVITGYCRTHPWSNQINLAKKPILGDKPNIFSYNFYFLSELNKFEKLIPTYFVGNTLTAFPRKIILETPYDCYDGGKFDGWASDFSFSKRLYEKEIKMYGIRGVFIEHTPKYENFIIGKIKPKITKEKIDGEEVEPNWSA